jgi:AcrR family transcriptional regulator
MDQNLRKDKILESAKAVFIHNGIKSSTIGEIAEHAGIGKPILYQHFPGKNEILEELVKNEVENLKDCLSKGIDNDDNPLIKMAHMWDNALSFYEKDDFLMYLLRGNELGLPPYMYNQYLLEIEAFVVNLIESIFKEAIEHELFVQIDSHVAAYISYKIYQACTYSKTDTIGNFTTKQIMQKVMGIMGAGLLNHKLDISQLLAENKITQKE